MLAAHKRTSGDSCTAVLFRRIAANIDAAVGAIAADLGLDWRVSRACIVVPRTAGLFAHAHEEMMREPGWRQIPLSAIGYDGPSRPPESGGRSEP